MCYRIKLSSSPEEIEKTFKADFRKKEDYIPKEEINGFDFPKMAVITDREPGEILFYQWGLIPHWAPDADIQKVTLNAKVETVTEKPAFKDSVQSRCLVIAEGFYEWHWNDSQGKEKEKYLITVANQNLFAFAGIHSEWRNINNGQTCSTFSILTTEANDLMQKIHNIKKRMPIILRHEDWDLWLKGLAIEEVAYPYETLLSAEKLDGPSSPQLKLF